MYISRFGTEQRRAVGLEPYLYGEGALAEACRSIDPELAEAEDSVVELAHVTQAVLSKTNLELIVKLGSQLSHGSKQRIRGKESRYGWLPTVEVYLANDQVVSCEMATYQIEYAGSTFGRIFKRNLERAQFDIGHTVYPSFGGISPEQVYTSDEPASTILRTNGHSWSALFVDSGQVTSPTPITKAKTRSEFLYHNALAQMTHVLSTMFAQVITTGSAHETRRSPTLFNLAERWQTLGNLALPPLNTPDDLYLHVTPLARELLVHPKTA